MRSLPLAFALLCASAVVAADLPGKASPAQEHADSPVVPMQAEGLRSSSHLELEAAPSVAAPRGGDIPSNGSGDAPANGHSAWRLGEPIGYYPADRGVSKRF